MTFLIFALLPLYYSIHETVFKRFLSKTIVYIDGILISLLIIALPTLIAFEFSLVETFLSFIVISTIGLIYCFLKYIEYVFDELNIKQIHRIILKTIQLFSWNLLSVFVAYTVFITFAPDAISQTFYIVLSASLITFFTINLNSLPIIEDIKQRVFENEELKLDFYKIYKIYEFYKNISFFAFIFSLSGLTSTLLSPFSYLIGDLIPLLFLSPEIIQFELLFLITLILLVGTQRIEIEYQKTRTWIILICWIIIKGTICGYVYVYFFSTPILAWSISILIFSVLSPITMHFIKDIRLVFGTTDKIVSRILILSFYSSLFTLYLTYFWSLRTNLFFSDDLILFWFLLISNSILYFDYVIMRLKDIFEGEFEFNLLKLYFKSSMVLCLFIFVEFYYVNLFLWLIAAIILLSRRNNNLISRYFVYILFTLSAYIYILNYFSFILPPEWRYSTIVLSISLLSVLFISISTNSQKVNDVEKFSMYLILSFLSFISFSLIPEFSIIPGLLYNGTFSLLIFLTLTGNHYYQKRDSRYKLFIRPCVVLAVFDFTSFLFYGLLFNNPPFFPDYHSMLSFTATFSLTGFTFVSLYHESPQRFRRLSFFIILPLLTLSVPVFVYFFTYATFPALRTSIIPLTISLNVGIIFFFVAIGLYQWKFSRAIWKTGFWAWILFPIVNYAIIDQSLANLSLRSLELFGFINIPASTLLAITICIVLSFPFWYSWIKAHFTTILFATWIINLGLLYWFSQFLFYGNDLLINSSFLIFAFILLMPLVYKLKIWRVLMAFWILFTIITISFIDFFFLSLGLEPPMVLSIDISVLGLSFIFLSYFPNMKNKRNLSLLMAYLILMTGISMMIYQVILISVFPDDPLGALYLTMIIISASSFSSRILKINKIVMNFLISWTLVVSFALMTFHIFSLIFPSDIGALYFSLTVGGLTFFIFNRYKMLWGPYENFMPISSFIAFIAVSLGASLSISSLILNLIILDNPWFLIIAVFLFTNIIFLSFKIKEQRFILSYLLPIPITSLILHFLLLFEPLSNPINLATLGILVYSLINQAFKIKEKFKAILRLILYLDGFIVSLLLLPFQDSLLNFFISMSILFLLTTFDSYLSKKQKYWYIVLVNLISYVSSTLFLFWYLNVILLDLFDYAIWLNSFIFLLLQKYTVHIFYTILKSLNKYNLEKLTKYKFILNFILSNSMYFLISLFGSLSLSALIVDYFSLIETSSLFLGMTLFCLFYFVLNSVFNKNVKSKIRDGIRSSLFIAFQATLLGLAFTLGLFDLLQFNLVIFNLTIIVFLVMQFYTVRTIFSFCSHFTWFDDVKALRIKQLIDNLLINSIFILLSFLGSSLFTISILQFYNIYLYLLLFSFFIFLLNGTLNKTIEKSLRVKYLLVPSYIAMQIFSLSLMVETMILSDINLSIFWLSLIALIETIMSIYPLSIVRKYTKIEARKIFISRSFKIVEFCLYLEITLLTFGLFYYNLGQDPFQSILYSQLVLFGLSILEIFVFKRLKEKFGYVMHLLSYVIISGALACLIFIFSLSEFLILPIILMQFYSNYAYYKMKHDVSPEKAESLQKWAIKRQRIIGNTFYAVLILLVSRFLLFYSGYEIQTSLFLISLLLHVIVLFDRGILIFLGRFSMSLIVISLILVNIFSIPALLTWIFSTFLSYRLIPLVILIFELELFYLTMLTHKWKRFKNLITSILYFNLSTWPLYFLIFSPAEILLDFNLILLTSFLLIIMVKIDKQVNALSEKISKRIYSIALIILGFGIPIDLFILLQTYYPAQLTLNIAFSALIGTIELGIISKPYKRKRVLSFLYTLSILLEILFIAHEINIPALGYSVLVLGTLIYLYMFLLEELKEFFSHIVDYISRGLNAIKSLIGRILRSIYNYLKKNYVVLKIIFAAILGGFFGYISTVFPLFGDTLGTYDYAPLFGLAVFGLIIGLLPGTKTEDPDKIFKTRMIRFSTVWFGITIFIFMIIMPLIEPLFQVILMLSSFLILGLILAIYVWRIEKKQKISIKWRLYITVVLIMLLIIWAILLVILYLTS
ncbi:MAG: hypothetical protein EU533_00715 [Promethearchaeota archaeon]|nr:MAG: hypothetical protein EU533_00715 [Candidatus Lokiarchaeota archaeon]